MVKHGLERQALVENMLTVLLRALRVLYALQRDQTKDASTREFFYDNSNLSAAR